MYVATIDLSRDSRRRSFRPGPSPTLLDKLFGYRYRISVPTLLASDGVRMLVTAHSYMTRRGRENSPRQQEHVTVFFVLSAAHSGVSSWRQRSTFKRFHGY